MSDSRSGFVRDVTKLVGGTAVAQVLGILVAPVLSRLYGPEAWGIAAVFGSVSGILLVLASFRYELAIVLPAAEDEAANVLGVSLLAATISAAVSLPVLLIWRAPLAAWLGTPGLEPYLGLVPLAVFFPAVFQALNYWNFRTRLYGRLAIARTTQAAVTSGSQILLAAVGLGTAGGLIWGVVTGGVIAAVILAWLVWRSDRLLLRAAITWRGMAASVSRYRKFPVLDAGGSLLNVVSQLSPPILLGIYFSQATVGQYALAMKLLYLPITFVGAALGQVFFQRAAETRARGESLAALTEDVFVRLVSYSLLPAAVLTIVGREALMLVFGAEWAEAGTFVELLAVWMFFCFVGSPLTMLFTVMQRLGSSFVMHVVFLGSRVAPLIIGGRYGDPFLALGLYSAAGVGAYGVIGAWTMGAAGMSWRAPLRDLFRAVVAAAPVALGLFLLDSIEAVPRWLVLAAAAGVLAYHGWRILRTDEQLASMLESALRRGRQARG